MRLPYHSSLLAFTARDAPGERARRVRTVLIATFMLSCIDLGCTVECMRSFGLFEDNPLVVLIMRETNSIVVLTLFKLLTLATGIGLLYVTRRRRSAELASWAALFVLCWVTMRWGLYMDLVASVDPAASARVVGNDPAWLGGY